MRISKPSKKTDELLKGWHLIYPIGSFQSTKDGPTKDKVDGGVQVFHISPVLFWFLGDASMPC